MKSNKKIIINDSLVYLPEEHRLIPLGVRGKETVLNVPASRCLQLLLKQPGITVSQSEFFSEVWEKNGQHITANTLYQNISLLRKGMREAGLAKNVIRTVPKIGVVYSGTVEVLEEENEEVIQEETSSKAMSSYKNEPTAASAQIPSSAPLNQRKLLRYSLYAVFIVIMTILLTSNTSQSEQFFNTHNRVASVNQCSVYIDRSDLATNVEGYKQYLTANNVVCHPDEFVYITRLPANQSTLVLFCDTTAKGDLRCSSRFKIDNKHDPLASLQRTESQ